MSKLTENMVDFREKMGITQTEVAKNIEVPRGTYSSWERDLAEPSVKWLIKMANYFNCSIDDLVGRKTWVDIDEEWPFLPEKKKEITVRVYGSIKTSEFNEDATFDGDKFYIDGIDFTDNVQYWQPQPQKPIT